MTIDDIEVVLNEVRPMLQDDGGDIEIVELTTDNVLKVRMKGACAGCPHVQMTIKNGVESYLKEKLPLLKAVEA